MLFIKELSPVLNTQKRIDSCQTFHVTLCMQIFYIIDILVLFRICHQFFIVFFALVSLSLYLNLYPFYSLS